MFLAVQSPPRATAAQLLAWRQTRLHPEKGRCMTQEEVATYLGVSTRTYQRFEKDGPPGWLARLVRADHIPPGFHRQGGAP